jgi:hypothetical protein
VAVAATFSSFVEALQVFAMGRSPSIVDVAANVVGAAIGVMLWRRLSLAPPHVWANKTVASAAAVLAVGYVAVGQGTTPADIEHAVDVWRSTNSSGSVNEQGSTSEGILEGRWSFDDVDGDVVRDDSRRGLDGTMVNRPALTTGINGNAVVLNGRNQWVSLDNPIALQFTGSMSITAWINPRTFPDDDAVIVSASIRQSIEALERLVSRSPMIRVV